MKQFFTYFIFLRSTTMRASFSFSARSLATAATAPLSPPSSSSPTPRARAPVVGVKATKKWRQEQQLQPSIIAFDARIASSDNASTSSSSSSPPSPAARTPVVANFAVLAAAVAGLAAFGGATAPHAAAAAALIDAAAAGIHVASPSTPLLADLNHLHLSPSISDLADSEDFWSNLLRYVSFYFSVLLGTAATAARPVVAALKRSPASAAGVIVFALVLGIFVTKTVGAMLGVDDGAPDDLSAFLDSNM